MAWKPTYDSRNRDNIAKLADNTKAAALKWYDYLIANKIDLLIYETIRTEAQQRENVRKGASQTMRSYHLVGQALDFVPVKGKEALWNGYGSADVKKAVSYAKKLGFEWGGDWTGFVDKPHLQYNYKGYGTDTFGGKSSKPSAPKGNQKTNSVVEYLDSIGVNSSFANRSKLAAQNGIKNYKGTDSQNLELLNKLRKGSAPKASKPKGDQKTGSLVDYLKSIGVSSSFSNREKLAKQYGIKGYRGTAEQNTALLKKIRGH